MLRDEGAVAAADDAAAAAVAVAVAVVVQLRHEHGGAAAQRQADPHPGWVVLLQRDYSEGSQRQVSKITLRDETM